MAESSFQERTEAATPRRREEARGRGQVPRSPEVGGALVLVAGAGVLHFGAAPLAGALVSLFDTSTRVAAVPPVGLPATAEWLRAFGWKAFAALAPVVVGISGLALAVGAVQARGTLTWRPLSPDWSRLSPYRNARRIFGGAAVVELVKSLVKLGIVGAVVYGSLSRAWPELVELSRKSPFALLVAIQRHSARLLLVAGLAFLGVALADYLYQVWKHEKSLRMTREEVKRETRETEGDPMVKARLRSMGRALARRRMLAEVPKADVVVTNPTHIAVALKYDPAVAPAPVVVAMGQRKLAERIKAIALAAGVPVIENRPLARALFATAKPGFPIPAELYVAVAEVLAFVIRQRARSSGWAGALVR
ncbi:MAG TPA: EscU/YscU/HrcU family type III secretion system export apparatus switch protein [Longimicrobiales bacterium]|jgi:flagellar biosynthetic protein FlhB